MKKFLLFLVVAISAISIGLTIYYFSIDNEVIYIRSSFLVVEKGDTISTDGLLDFRYRDENTTLSFGVSQDEGSEVLLYDSADGFFTANEGGESKIVINTTNKNYPQLIIDVRVCDGSAEYPYIVTNEEDLLKIGREVTGYSPSAHYTLGGNITLTEKEGGNWTPISNFSGTIDGSHYIISNIDITDSTKGSSNNVGFIGSLEKGGVIENLFLTDLTINVTNASNVGSVVGLNKGTVRTTEVVGSIVNTNENVGTYVGGVVGSNLDEDDVRPVVDRCGFEGAITLIGETGNQIAGGVAGFNRGGNVSESYYRTNEQLFLENYNSKFGGIVGKNEGSQNPANIYDSYLFLGNGTVNTVTKNIGGVVYSNYNGTGVENTIMGNYYGGTENSSSFSNGDMVAQDSDVINKGENGYLSLIDFQDENSFVTYRESNASVRGWNFDSVWSIPSIEYKYPILNTYSAKGSDYPTDLSGVIGETDITTPQEFYDAFSNSSEDASYVLKGVIDFEGQEGFVWGDEEHPIPQTFSGTITCEPNTVIKNLKIVGKDTTIATASTESDVVNLGLVGTLSDTAKIIGLKFEGVTIVSENINSYYDYVGVLAGVNEGAEIYDISIKDVTVSVNGYAFGTLFGFNENKADRYIQKVDVQSVDASGIRFGYAGGLVGENFGTITANTAGEDYNRVNNIKLNASYMGGVAGYNEGNISYVDVNALEFSGSDEKNPIYSTGYSLIIGGVTAHNLGAITDVYVSSLRITARAGKDYMTAIGGTVGYNEGNISRAYTTGLEIVVDTVGYVGIGGIAGFNYDGLISRSVVNGGTLKASTILAVENADDLSNCSFVGGLVGFDRETTYSTSVVESAVKSISITGFYAGGLAGHANGKIERCYAGSQDHNISVRGYYAGGLAAVVNGKIVDSYTNVTLYGEYTKTAYAGPMSLYNMEVSATAGLAVAVLSNAEVKGCYTVAEFKEGGVRFSTALDYSSLRRNGKITGCIYVTEGNANLNSFGVQLSRDDLNGATDNYQSFFKNIGSDDKTVWDYSGGRYPVLKGLDSNLPVIK